MRSCGFRDQRPSTASSRTRCRWRERWVTKGPSCRSRAQTSTDFFHGGCSPTGDCCYGVRSELGSVHRAEDPIYRRYSVNRVAHGPLEALRKHSDSFCRGPKRRDIVEPRRFSLHGPLLYDSQVPESTPFVSDLYGVVHRGGCRFFFIAVARSGRLSGRFLFLSMRPALTPSLMPPLSSAAAILLVSRVWDGFGFFSRFSALVFCQPALSLPVGWHLAQPSFVEFEARQFFSKIMLRRSPGAVVATPPPPLADQSVVVTTHLVAVAPSGGVQTFPMSCVLLRVVHDS